MQKYTVTYTIELEAETPEGAACEALHYLNEPAENKIIFEVSADQESQMITVEV